MSERSFCVIGLLSVSIVSYNLSFLLMVMYFTFDFDDIDVRVGSDDDGGAIGATTSTVRRRLFTEDVGPEVVYESREVTIELLDGVYHWLFTDLDAHFEREYYTGRSARRHSGGNRRYNYRIGRGNDFESIWKRAMTIESREGFPAAAAA